MKWSGAVLCALLVAPVSADDAVPASIESPSTEPWSCLSVTLEPASLVVTTTLSAQVERLVISGLGLAVLGGVGSTTNVAIGDRIHNYMLGPTVDMLEDVRYRRLHVGGQVNYYSRRFSGGHVGAELVYLHYGWAAPARADIDVISGSAYAGWKWFVRSRVILVMQLGLGAALTSGEDLMRSGFIFDREGSFGPVHLAANLSVGWSF